MATKPPVEVPQGAIRFNTDSRHLEFFAQDKWWEFDKTSAMPAAGRGVFGGWNTPTSTAIDTIQIQTTGNSTDFGDATAGSYEGSSGASNTRGVITMGYIHPAYTNAMQYVTIATRGNAIDFGDNTAAAVRTVGHSNQTRAMYSGSEQPSWTSGQTDIVTIASTGSATDFGDTANTGASGRGAGSTTRALYIGGRYLPGGGDANVVEYATIQSTGTWVDFGDLAEGGPYGSAGSCSTRALYTCDNAKIDFCTIATLGNWQSFGDLPQDVNNLQEAAADPTRCVFGAGYKPPGTAITLMQSSQFATLGTAIKFGDMTEGGSTGWGLSNAHGGLG